MRKQEQSVPALGLLEVGPAALRVVRRLRRQVLAGQLTVGMELPSVRRLAEMSGIGVVTANRALQRVESEGWAEQYVGGRRRVVREAERLARELILREPPVVITRVEAANARVGGEVEAHDLTAGFTQVFPRCLVRQVYLGTQTSSTFLKQLLREQSEVRNETGYMLAGMPAETKEFFAHAEVPTVVRGYVEPHINLPCVYEDMQEVGRMAGQLLCPAGRTVALCAEKLVGAEVCLVDGVRRAAEALGQTGPRADDFYVHLPAELDAYVAIIERLLSRPDRPRGILAIRPEYALVTVQVAARRGIRIPDEVQVVGLHHHPMYRFTHPEITSIGPRSMVELGRACAELLAEVMGQQPTVASRDIIQSTLVERGSTRGGM
ncbi:MAG: substrate-binding domain-containing protein [Phycisphaerae bacterium]|nr:substrate-binding domain-containing protein [Phycisphaerae bacterium]